jgi:hypothetical protein
VVKVFSSRALVSRYMSYALALLLPLAVFWPIGRSPEPAVPDVYVRPALYLSDLAGVASLLATLARRQLFAAPRPWGREGALLAALVALAFLTAPAALSPALAIYTGLRWLLVLGVYWALARNDGPAETWVAIFVTGLGLHVCLGMAQVLAQGPLGLPGEAALPSHEFGAAILTVGERHWLRAYGLTFHPNVLGGCLAIGLLLALPLLDRFWARSLWWLLGVGLFLSFSRSAWLATGLVLPPLSGWLAWRRPDLRRPLAATLGGAALILLVAGGLLAGQLVSRLRPLATTTESRSLQERGQLIGLALDVVVERPLTGVGAGNFALAVQRVDALADPQPVHYVPLLLAAEVGLVGGAIWFCLWLAPCLALGNWPRGACPWPVVLGAAWFAWGLIGLWDSHPWALNSGLLLSAALLGLIGRARRLGASLDCTRGAPGLRTEGCGM